jgi:hypothetical protein
VDDATEPVTVDSAAAAENKYARLPAPIRYEEMRTSQDVVPHPEVVGEADRERDWLLRTSGIFI